MGLSFVRALGVVVMLGALLAACTGPPSSRPALGLDTAPSSAPPATAEPVVPAGIEIPSLDVRSTLYDTGLATDGSLEVPPVDKPRQASYYRFGPMPGQPGPAIVLGHINGKGGAGVFARLPELDESDRVTITTDQGPIAFAVYKKIKTLKNVPVYPWAEITAPTDGPELRLITCTGKLIPGKHSFDSNLIVFAKLAPTP